MKYSTLKLTFVSIFALFLCAGILLFPTISAKGVQKGLIICADVIIPSLFPFCVIALFMQKSGVFSFLSKFFSKFSKTIFHLNGEEFCVFLLSFFCGFPIGIKMINELYENKKISHYRASKMSIYCVNAGPTFVISAIGAGILGDISLGKILLLSNFVATFLLAIIVEFREKSEDVKQNIKNTSLSEVFVESTTKSAESMFSICAWIVLFSGLFEILKLKFIPQVIYKILLFSSEVTMASVEAGGNILLISAILSFCGFSVHCQIYSMGRKIMCKYYVFLAFRIMHALFSTVTTFLLLKFDNRAIQTISNGISAQRENASFTYSSAIALLILCVCLIISVNNRKKYNFCWKNVF